MSTARLNSAATLAPAGNDAIRRVTEDGTEYLVAPTVALQEGVYQYPHPSGRGIERQYIDAEAIQSTVNEWAGKPLTLDHPTDASGDPTTLQSGDAVETNVIGEVRNPDAEAGKLTPEAWIDLSKQGSFDGDLVEIVTALEAGNVIETSTGYQADIQPERGVYNGRSYDAQQTNPTPDHLAVFRPNSSKTGNCSVEGGCGVGRVNERPGVVTGIRVDERPADDESKRDMQETDNVAVSDEHAATLGRRVLNALGIGSGDEADATDIESAAGTCACGRPLDECDCHADADTTNESPDTSDNDVAEEAAEADEETPADSPDETMTDETETESEADTEAAADTTETEPNADTEDVDAPPETEGEVDVDETLSAMQERIDALEEQNETLREKVEAPEREAQQQAAEAVANELGIDAEDVDLSPDAAEKVLAEETGQRQPQQTANMAAVPGQVTRANEEPDVDVPATGYDAWKARQERDD